MGVSPAVNMGFLLGACGVSGRCGLGEEGGRGKEKLSHRCQKQKAHLILFLVEIKAARSNRSYKPKGIVSLK